MPLLDIFAYVSLLLVICVLLAKSADLIENSLVFIAQKLKINPFIIGFVVLSVASSLPEISLVVASASSQDASLSVGNLVGGMIILLTLVLALNVIKQKKVTFSGRFQLPQVYAAISVIAASPIALLDGELNFLEGILLFVLYVLFVISIYVDPQGTHHQEIVEKVVTFSRQELINTFAKAIVGVILILLLAKLAVEAAVHTATILNVPESIVGLLILALGTNIPEITITLRSKDRLSKKLALGNVLGSATINTAILGMLGLLAPHQLPNVNNIIPSLIILGGALALLAVTATTGKIISKQEGFALVSLYVIFIIMEGLIILL